MIAIYRNHILQRRNRSGRALDKSGTDFLHISMEYRYNRHYPITRFRLNKRVRYDWLGPTGSDRAGKVKREQNQDG